MSLQLAADGGSGILRPMFPHTVDSTILAAFRSCPQKAFRSYIEHWKPKEESVHLVAGGAFAKGIEVARKAYFEGIVITAKVENAFNNETAIYEHKVSWEESVDEANYKGNSEAAQQLGLAACMAAYGDFECPPDSAKSLERTVGALEFYYDHYPFGADGTNPVTFPNGRRGIEFSFAEPLDFRHPVTGDPVLYTGRSDMVAEFAGGTYVFDEKTTSQLGASWPRQWELRSQFTGYVWAAQRAGLSVQGAVVRGVSILKTKYDTAQAMTYRSPFEIERWLTQVNRDLKRMKECWEEGWWDWDLDHACSEYGGCGFQRICKSDDPEAWLPMYYERRVWDPLARKQMTVEEFEASWGHKPAA
jgi:hypothetical protein